MAVIIDTSASARIRITDKEVQISVLWICRAWPAPSATIVKWRRISGLTAVSVILQYLWYGLVLWGTPLFDYWLAAGVSAAASRCIFFRPGEQVGRKLPVP